MTFQVQGPQTIQSRPQLAGFVVYGDKLKQLQCEDHSLKVYLDQDDTLVKGQAEVSFEQKSGVLKFTSSGKPVKQVMVPKSWK